MNHPANDIDDTLSDDVILESGVAGRRKKKRSLAANLLSKPESPQIGKPTAGSLSNGEVQDTFLLTTTSVASLKQVVPTPDTRASPSSSKLSNIYECDGKETPPTPSIAPLSVMAPSTGPSLDPLPALSRKSSSSHQLLPPNDTTLPLQATSKTPIQPSDSSPRPSVRSRLSGQLSHPILGTSMGSANVTGNSINSAPKSGSGGESNRPRTTPRPLPPHLKQVFNSISTPRNSLTLSTAQSINEELMKSVATLKASRESAINTQNIPETSSFLRRLSTRDVRTRSYLVGCLGSQLSLGGKPELEYYFPDRLLRVFAGTWNMAAMKTLPADLESFILPDYASSDFTSTAPHIIVISSQESMSDRKRWLIKIQETLGQHFVLLCAPYLGALGLCIFIRRELIWYTSAPQEATSSPNPYQPIATKGSIAAAFEVFGTSFLFINSHFSAGEGNIAARIEDYRRAISELKLSPPSIAHKNAMAKQRPFTAPSLAGNFFNRRINSANVPSTQAGLVGSRRPISADEVGTTPRNTNDKLEDVTSLFDCVFWMGDFNFRVTRERHHVDEMIKGFARPPANAVMPVSSDELLEPAGITNSYEVLLEHDEMSKELSHGRVFVGFHEGRIRFMPTYKFDIGSSRYDSSTKLRIQSYTDRIVFRSKRKNAVTCLAYNSVESLMTSDHKPLYGVYDVELRPGLDAIPTGAGCFDREIYLSGLQQRSQVVSNDKNSAVCSIQ